MSENECPRRQDSLAYCLGKVPEDDSGVIGEHIESCADCQETVSAAPDPHDTVLTHLRTPVPPDPYGEEPEYQQAVAAVLGYRPEPFTGVDGSAVGIASIGPYQLLEKLAEGGMGAVYKVRHAKLNRVMALKLLAPGRMKQGEAVARFEREMQAAGRLDHPNIVRATDAGEHEGIHYLAMEYVDGVDLHTLAKWHGRLPVADACEVVRQAAWGLQHAHEHGLVVHRDIKPSNLMLQCGAPEPHDSGPASSIPHPASRIPHPASSPTVKILDLGLARVLAETADELTTTNQVMGTLDYMAPEQGDHPLDVDARADIYSLGATLYKLLCGQAPYADDKHQGLVQKLKALATEPVPPIRERCPDVPEQLARVLDRMLAKEPPDRYGTAAEVAQALAPWAAGSDLRQLLPSPLGPAAIAPKLQPRPQTARRRTPVWRRVALSLAGLAAVILGVVVYVQTQYGRLVITGKADDIKLVVEGNGKTRIVDPKLQRTIRIWPGEYGVHLEEERAGYSISAESFTIRRRGEVVLEVRYEPGPAAPPTGENSGAAGGEAAAGQRPLKGFVPRPATFPGIRRWQIPRFSSAGHEKIGPAVRCVRWSPDGTLLAVSSASGYLRVFSRKGKPGSAVQGHSGFACRVAWRADGSQLASCGNDSTVHVWTRELEPVRVMKTPIPYLGGLAWDSVTGRLAAGGSYGGLLVWDADGELIKTLPAKEWLFGLAWSPDGKWLAAQAMRDVWLWNSDLTKTRVLDGGGKAVDIAWSPNSSRFAVAEMQDEIVQLWTVDGKKGPVLRGHRGEVWAVAWSPDSQTLASGADDGTVRMWREDGTSGPVLQGHTRRVWSVSWSPEGTKLASGAEDGTLIVWDVRSREPEWIAVELADGASATFAADGRLRYGDLDAVEDGLVYAVESKEGEFETLKPSEFYRRVPEAVARGAEDGGTAEQPE